MTRRIKGPEHFQHAGLLNRIYGDWDPRRSNFGSEALDIDLSDCEFIRPPAIMWSAVYALLVRNRGTPCRLVVPGNFGVCIHLKSVGLFDLLREAGVDVDDRGVPITSNPQVVVPIRAFSTEADTEQLADEALDALNDRGLGAANIHPLVTEVFAELALNAVQHSESPFGGLGSVQFYQFSGGSRFVITVADGGIGIRESLQRNPAFYDAVTYDWDAIELALREGVTGTASPTRGIGLYGVAEEMQRPGRQLIIHSGQGMLNMSAASDRTPARTATFPGTLISASIPT